MIFPYFLFCFFVCWLAFFHLHSKNKVTKIFIRSQILCSNRKRGVNYKKSNPFPIIFILHAHFPLRMTNDDDNWTYRGYAKPIIGFVTVLVWITWRWWWWFARLKSGKEKSKLGDCLQDNCNSFKRKLGS